ncbi:MAG: acetoin utilization protein AcuC [Rhodospirillales bacterium]|nr:acetoin utilization protein AcuC [Rhodospirillales bacterium]
MSRPSAPSDGANPTRPIMIGSDIYRTSKHASGHPLAIPRVSLCIDLCRALGWLSEGEYIESPQASAADLCRFHEPAYVAAVQRCERRQLADADDRARFNLGVNGNPIYADMFRRPATACGASLAGARRLRDGGVVYNPAGGTHHGLAARASGFCIFNDPVLAILALLEDGSRRVFYLDLDAHFGDGVQFAFADDDRVFTLSLHEGGRWPMAREDTWTAGPGGVHDRAGGTARNLPLPRDLNDSEMAVVIAEAVLPLIEAFAPQALVVQCGADALAEDPMTKLSLSNRALWGALDAVRTLAPRLLVLGGGGYNPWSVARCWAGVWATLTHRPIPERLPDAAEALLRAVHWPHRRGRTPPAHWFTTIADAPNAGLVRPEVYKLVELVMRP